MRRPIVTRFQPDPALSWERQRAVDRAFQALNTDAFIFRVVAGDVHSARRCARECRALVQSFGVRLPQRKEISVAQQEQVLADFANRRQQVAL